MKNKMKKFIALIIGTVMMFSLFSFSANAYRVGDVIGYALKTDIVATINGYDIPSYNVDGYTYIVVEDLRNYGFSVNYDNSTRTLAVVRDFSKTTVTAHYIKPYVSPSQVGQREHTLLYTDIVTYLNGNYTPSYNINGQTIIRFDALSAYGAVSYDNNKREISLAIEQLEKRVVIDSEEVAVWQSMSGAERREVNIFLSNFCEAYYEPHSPYAGTIEEEMIGFAAKHIMLNKVGRGFEYTNDGYMGVYASDVDTVLKRFFGKTVAHATPSGSREWFYRDGKFLMRAGMGETYAYFIIADGMYLLQDGTYDVEFTVYLDNAEGPGSAISDKSVYSLTSQQAKSNSRFSVSKSGWATVIPKVHNGENTYELVDYYLYTE